MGFSVGTHFDDSVVVHSERLPEESDMDLSLCLFIFLCFMGSCFLGRS